MPPTCASGITTSWFVRTSFHSGSSAVKGSLLPGGSVANNKPSLDTNAALAWGPLSGDLVTARRMGSSIAALERLHGRLEIGCNILLGFTKDEM